MKILCALLLSMLAVVNARPSARTTIPQDPCPADCSPIASCFPSNANVEGGPFFEAWVDPISGNDGTARITHVLVSGVPTSVAVAQSQPFKKIQAAIDAVYQHVCSQGPIITMPGIVHLMPGIYETASPSSQEMPVRMRNGVNLQGAGARHCVLKRGASREVFYPTGSCNSLDCGTYDDKNVIVDFSSSVAFLDPSCSTTPTEFEYSEAIDGVTFYGGGVQVYANNPHIGVHGRISNCIFDMVHRPSVEAGPDFGVFRSSCG